MDPKDLKQFLEERARQDWAPQRHRFVAAVLAESLSLRREATTWRNDAQGCESDAAFEGALNEADKLDMRANDLEDAAATLTLTEELLAGALSLLRGAHNNAAECPGALGSVTVSMMARVESDCPLVTKEESLPWDEAPKVAVRGTYWTKRDV